MGHVMRERHWSNNYQHLFINWEAKEIDHSIFIKACKDFANVLSDTRMSEKYVDHIIYHTELFQVIKLILMLDKIICRIFAARGGPTSYKV